MLNDPIVEEIHRIRDKMLAECGGDMEKYMDRLSSTFADFERLHSLGQVVQ